MKYRIPIGKCPCCKHTILYCNDPKLKNNIIIRIAEDEYDGTTVLCAKCKTMLAVIEKPVTADNYTAIPIYKKLLI